VDAQAAVAMSGRVQLVVRDISQRKALGNAERALHISLSLNDRESSRPVN
jgi:hypothetical protein